MSAEKYSKPIYCTTIDEREKNKRNNSCLSTVYWFITEYIYTKGFPSGLDGKESACNVGDLGLIPGSGRSPRGENGSPLQNSCLENPYG